MSTDIGIDLGTSSIIAYVKGKGIVLREPSVVSVDKTKNEIIAYGKEAKRMIGKTPKHIQTIMPLSEGVISDFTLATKMLKHFIKKACSNRFIQPRIMICVPSQISEVERRAVIDASLQSGAKRVYLIEEPVAAAIGAGVDISKPSGNLIIDIGGGTTDIAVISIGNSVVNTTIKVAGDKFDEAIIKYIKKKYKTVIGKNEAEELKKKIGSVYPKDEDETAMIFGSDIDSGLPNSIEIKSSELIRILLPEVMKIIDALKFVLEKTPPELVEDISEKGIYVTGGGSLIYGLDKVIENNTGIKVMVAQDAVSCVAIGTGKALENINKFDTQRRKAN